MKILHYNIHMWTDTDGINNADRVEALIKEQDPDLVSLVEVDELWGQPSTLADIAQRLGYHWAFVPAFEYRCEGGFGNALLSRTPLSSVQQWQLLSPSLYDGTEPSEPRAVILAAVTIEGVKLTVGSTHLPRHDPAKRQEATARLLDLLDRLPEPWIVCGDFNQLHSAWIADRHYLSPPPALPSYPASEPVEAIDYVVSSGILLEAEPIEWVGSDHLPILGTADVARLSDKR